METLFLLVVPQFRSFARYWLPVLIWMALIFSVSSDTHSSQHSSRIIGPILHWLFPHMSDRAVDGCVLVARKCAHLAEYAVLAFLFWRALRKPRKADSRPWSWRKAGLAILFVAVYASTDEFHQRFVPSREASPRDVLIDTTGAVLGMLALRTAWRWRNGRAQFEIPKSPEHL